MKPCNINIGDKIIVTERQRNKTLPCYDQNPHIVYIKKGSMIVARRDGHAITRKSSFFKNNSQNMFDDSYSDYEEQKNEINEPETKITLRRSTKCATTL